MLVALETLSAIALALWTGGIAFLSFGTAPVAFRVLDSPQTAGKVVGEALHRLNRIEIVCALVLVIALGLEFALVGVRSNVHVIRAVVVVMMALLMLTYTYWVSPQLVDLRERGTEGDEGLKSQFDALHKLYVRMMALNLLLGLGAIFLSVYLRTSNGS